MGKANHKTEQQSDISKTHYKAKCKTTGEIWTVYSLTFGGYPNPKLDGISVLLNDNSDFEMKFLDEVDLIAYTHK